jgi:hypothetical protein
MDQGDNQQQPAIKQIAYSQHDAAMSIEQQVHTCAHLLSVM